MTLTHIADAVANYAASLIAAEGDVQCMSTGPDGQCPEPATWDLLRVCDGGHDAVAHHCTPHKDRWLSMQQEGHRWRCAAHPKPWPLSRYVAAYPRRRA